MTRTELIDIYMKHAEQHLKDGVYASDLVRIFAALAVDIAIQSAPTRAAAFLSVMDGMASLANAHREAEEQEEKKHGTISREGPVDFGEEINEQDEIPAGAIVH